MCGIAGIFTFDSAAGTEPFARSVKTMTSLMARRGPDDEGFWPSPDGRIQFGFRRLSVLDLSPAGHQPMISASGRSAIVFNGEIYNFQEIRKQLEGKGLRFRSKTDTEVLLEALEQWGEAALQKLNGMFAFAFYDLKTKSLLLARDHAGIKPLYYFAHSEKKGIAFASQYNALLHTPWGSPGPMRPDVLHLYLRLHHIPQPWGILKNTWQLEPGHYARIDAEGRIEKKCWWSLPRHSSPDLKGREALSLLEEKLEAAVKRQRISDVPLGVFLSGGVDSPLVSAIAGKQTGGKLKAFTISNPGWQQDETNEASAYAAHLGVEHRLKVLKPGEVLQNIQEAASAQHEPFADFSMIPTLCLSRFTREEVTVSLSGDGGDELFFGYERPLSLLRNGKDFRLPYAARSLLYAAGKFHLGPARSGTVLYPGPGEYYFDVNSRLKEPELRSLAPGLSGMPEDFRLYDFEKYQGLHDLADFSRYAEFYGQLQRVLKKVDMASMHHSLEVRVPLLDREVIEASLRVDPFESMAGGGRKQTLRKMLSSFVPENMIQNPKKGFSVPLSDWLRGELRPMVEDTLFGRPLWPDGLFNQKALRRYWEAHLSGGADRKWGIWTLLSLQFWADQHLKAAHA